MSPVAEREFAVIVSVITGIWGKYQPTSSPMMWKEPMTVLLEDSLRLTSKEDAGGKSVNSEETKSWL